MVCACGGGGRDGRGGGRAGGRVGPAERTRATGRAAKHGQTRRTRAWAYLQQLVVRLRAALQLNLLLFPLIA